MTKKDDKRKDTGEETFTVTARGHLNCVNTGNCGEPGCPFPKETRPGVVRRLARALVRRARGRR